MDFLFDTVWRLYHGKFSGAFCFGLYLFVIFGIYYIVVLLQSKNKTQKISGTPALQHLILLFLPIFLYTWALFPGIYVYDSLVQLKEAESGIFSDWHPPLMSWMWSVLLRTTALTESYFFFQIFLLSSAATVWFIILLTCSKSHWPFVALAILSPIWLLISGVIVKDAVMAYSLLLGFGLVILAQVQQKNRWIYYPLAFALIFISINFRQNSLPASFPLIYLIVSEIPALKKRIPVCAALTIFVALILFTTGKIINYEYIKPSKCYIQQALFFHDLSFLKKSGGLQVEIPDSFKTIHYSEENLSQSWKSQSSVSLFFEHDNASPPLKFVGNEVETKNLFNVWLISIWNNPLKYIQHRLLVFNSFLWSKGFYQSENEKLWQDFNLDHLHPKFSLLGSALIDHVLSRSTLFLAEFTPFFYPGFWFLALIVIIVFCSFKVCSDEIYRMPIALSTSGFLYFAVYFLIAPHCEFRYVYWSVIAGIFSFALMFRGCFQLRSETTTSQASQSRGA